VENLGRGSIILFQKAINVPHQGEVTFRLRKTEVQCTKQALGNPCNC
jgi:hypothetical protein